MAYPQQIGPDPSLDPTLKTALPFRSAARPAYRGSGKVYQMMRQGTSTTHHLSAWKSSADGDESPWAEQDNANRPTISRGDYGACHTFDDGVRLWNSFYRNDTFPPTEFVVQPFNTTSGVDAWESATTLTNAPTPDDNTGAVRLNGRAMFGSVVRANGDICTVYSEMVSVSSNNLCSLKLKINSGGAWGSAIDVVGPTPSELINFELIDVALGADGSRIHGFALNVSLGFVHFIIRSDNSVVWHRYYHSVPTALGTQAGYVGAATLLTLGPTTFAALPIGLYVGAVSGTHYWKPAALLVEDADEVGPFRLESVEETVEIAASWFSVGVYSESGALRLVWIDADKATYDTVIRSGCTKGFAWSAPATVFTPSAGQLIETMEISVDGGVLRMVLENSEGESPFLYPHYAQVSGIVCTAPGCPAAGSSRNRSFR